MDNMDRGTCVGHFVDAAANINLHALAERCGIVGEFTEAQAFGIGFDLSGVALWQSASKRYKSRLAKSDRNRQEWVEIVPPFCVLHREGAALAYAVTLRQGTRNFTTFNAA